LPPPDFRQSAPGPARDAASPAPPDGHRGQAGLWPRQFFSDLRVIGQFQDTYILCEAPGQLVLIDQHAAHERIYYEELRDQAGSSRPAVQLLALPEKIELDHTEAVLLQALLPELARAGLEIEPFGGTAFVIRAVPQLLAGADLRPLLLEMVEKMAAEGAAPQPGRLADDCLKVMACHGAIRANQRLAPAQIAALLQRLDSCRDPAHCPHGRPTFVTWPLKDIEKDFGRIKNR
jgi:DNA mismatch repair protein MutL